jgi:predicted metal-dependent phosphoesterase TrpH
MAVHKTSPLLCELHAHTTWSDGALRIRELCDLYGGRGFDVLAVTDHTHRQRAHVHDGNFADYLVELEREATRALALYGLMVVPGLELTYDDPDPSRAAHAVAVGVRSFVTLDDGLDSALAAARAQGAALIAAHPYEPDAALAASRRTAAFAARRDELRPLVDRFELFNRETLFGWVADAGFPVVASGDFHRPEHLPGWKTLLPCPKNESAVIAYLRSDRPTYLARLDRGAVALAA